MKAIDDFLAEHDIPVTKREHPPVFTVEEARQHFVGIPGGHTKNLFLRNKDKSRYYLLIVEDHKDVDLNALRKDLGESKLSFGSPEDMLAMLGTTPGSVSPFGLIFDSEIKISVLMDHDLWNYDTLHFHPNENTATYELDIECFRKFLGATDHPVLSLSIPVK